MPLIHEEPSWRPLGRRERARKLLDYAWRQRRVHLVTMALAIVSFVLVVFYFETLRPPWGFRTPSDQSNTNMVGQTNMPSSAILQATSSAVEPGHWLDWFDRLQSFFAIFTLIVAVFVWVNELAEDWENDLPNRMSVYYFHNGCPAIVCRHVWLAGAGDVRAWGQQVGAQAAGGKFDFSPDVAARAPEIVVTSKGAICKHYQVRFILTKRPEDMIKQPDICRYQNLEAMNNRVRDVPAEQVEKLPDVRLWGMERTSG